MSRLEADVIVIAAVTRYCPGGEQTWHLVKPETGKPGPRAASAMIKCMVERAEELGVDIRYECPVREIRMEDGRVAGVVGDGIRMAWAVGAGHGRMTMEASCKPRTAEENFPVIVGMNQPGGVLVNLGGERLLNEEHMENAAELANVIDRQPGKKIFNILPDAVIQRYKKHGPDYSSGLWGGMINQGAYGTLGGIRINSKLQVVTDAYVPIPGLYGAGSDVCDIYAGTYIYKLAGNTMGFALNSGRLAAEHALEYLDELDAE